jgi:hypothetical protein
VRRGQNSAGRYPLISRPMQISTRIGVVQAIGRFPSVSEAQVKSPRAAAQAPSNEAGGNAEFPAMQKIATIHVSIREMFRKDQGGHDAITSFGSALSCWCRAFRCKPPRQVRRKMSPLPGKGWATVFAENNPLYKTPCCGSRFLQLYGSCRAESLVFPVPTVCGPVIRCIIAARARRRF